MRYLFGFVCVCAMGAISLLGCATSSEPQCQIAADCDDGIECTEDACTGGTCSNAPFEDGTECSEGACLDAACTTLTTVEGVVTLYQSYTQQGPAEDATVRVRGTSLSTTTDSRGWFSIDVFEGDWFFESSMDGLWGWIQLAPVPYPGSALDLPLLSDTLIGQFAEELDIEIDAAKAIAVVDFNESSGQGGETATLSAPYVHVSAQDADQNEVLWDELLPGGGSELWYYNVDPTEELSVTPAGADGVNICELQFPEAVYPVVGKVITFVELLCTPTP